HAYLPPLFSPPLFFFSTSSSPPIDLHSFPTRRSSDLPPHRRRRGRTRQSALRRGCTSKLGRGRGPQPGRLPRAERRAMRILFVGDRKSTRLNSSHDQISYAVFCLKKKK